MVLRPFSNSHLHGSDAFHNPPKAADTDTLHIGHIENTDILRQLHTTDDQTFGKHDDTLKNL